MEPACVAAVLRNHALYVANVGESRVYIVREGRLRQVTHDHAEVAQLVERGDTLVLCTDGLWSALEQDELRAIVEP